MCQGSSNFPPCICRTSREDHAAIPVGNIRYRRQSSGDVWRQGPLCRRCFGTVPTTRGVQHQSGSTQRLVDGTAVEGRNQSCVLGEPGAGLRACHAIAKHNLGMLVPSRVPRIYREQSKVLGTNAKATSVADVQVESWKVNSFNLTRSQGVITLDLRYSHLK